MTNLVPEITVITSLADVSYLKDGLIEIRFTKDEYEVDLHEQDQIQLGIKSIVEQGIQIRNVLVIPGLYGTVTKEAREKGYFSNSVLDEVNTMAVVTPAVHHRLLGRAYFAIRSGKINYDVKFFKTELKATSWLLKS